MDLDVAARQRLRVGVGKFEVYAGDVVVDEWGSRIHALRIGPDDHAEAVWPGLAPGGGVAAAALVAVHDEPHVLTSERARALDRRLPAGRDHQPVQAVDVQVKMDVLDADRDVSHRGGGSGGPRVNGLEVEMYLAGDRGIGGVGAGWRVDPAAPGDRARERIGHDDDDAGRGRTLVIVGHGDVDRV